MPNGSTVIAPKLLAYAVMAFTPLFFSTNLVFGRGVAEDVAPFTLALFRWGAVALVFAPLIWREREKIQALSGSARRRIGLLGFLGMWVCGAMVYIALDYTTATNATLLYTTSSVMIILIEAAFFGRKSGWREAIGIVFALCGIVVIVIKGNWSVLMSLRFNPGDIIILFTAFSWALYSVLQRKPEIASLPALPSLGMIAAAGAAWLAPFAVYEYASGQQMPVTVHAWQSIAGIIVFASLLAFSGYQVGIRSLGPTVSGTFMYLLPVYGVALAVILLDESLAPHHLVGATLVIGGVIVATLPARRRST